MLFSANHRFAASCVSSGLSIPPTVPALQNEFINMSQRFHAEVWSYLEIFTVRIKTGIETRNFGILLERDIRCVSNLLAC